ncbi:MAG TPA: hypothetical protein VK469_04325 [Candidatus Kapabacteria bacterium]|nr:hypothetical protein [Candidatus Kapabacteria bacterium]
MLFSKVSLADYFFNSRHALHIAANNPKIQPLIAEYNMNPEKIDIGIAKLDKVIAADKQKTEAHGKQLELRLALQTLFDDVHPLYMSHVKLARVKFRATPERVARLMLSEPRKTRINDWLRQSGTFYTNILIDNEIATRLEESAITPEKLDAAYDRVKEVELAHNSYLEAKGLAQATLEDRNALLKDFEAWMKEFIVVCKIALRRSPQLLEALGIVVLSKGYVRAKSEELPPEKRSKQKTKTPVDNLPPETTPNESEPEVQQDVAS